MLLRLLFLVFFSCSAPARADGVRVEDAWIRAAPPGARVLAGYARVVNDGTAAVRILAAHGADFESVVLHEMRMDQGMMRMRALESIEVPAHGSVAFVPGGTHLMLNAPKRALRIGDETVVEFRIAGGESFSATLVVRESP